MPRPDSTQSPIQRPLCGKLPFVEPSVASRTPHTRIRRALKAEPANELFSDALWEESLCVAISESALERMLRYVLNADSNVPLLKERIRKIHSKPLQTKTMTIADQLRHEGKREGREEGLSEGQLIGFRTAVLRALEIKHGSYPEGIREAVGTIKDPKRLEQLLESAFRSESLETFAQRL